MIPIGTLLMSFKLSIGRVSTLGINACHNEAIISIYPNEIIDKEYLGYYISHIDYSDFYDRQIKGNTLNKEKIDRITIRFPKKNEQIVIAGVLNKIRMNIRLAKKQEALTLSLKHATMRKLFTRGLRGEPQKETEIGLVPKSWEVSALGTLCSHGNGRIQTGPFGSQLHAYEHLSEGIPVINPTHLNGNRINHEDVPRVSPATVDRLQRHKVKTGDILFGRRGAIGRHGLVSSAEDGWLCGTGCFLVRVTHAKIDNAFLSYFFSTDAIIAWLNAHAAGAIMPNLNNVVLSTMPVVYPQDDHEQREIISILDAIDRKIDLHRRKKAVLEELFKSMLYKLMNGAIRTDELDLSALSPQENEEKI